MSINTVESFVEILRRQILLSNQQLAQLTPEFLSHFESPKTLAKHLVRADWLTVYQVNHLFESRSHDLMIGHYCIVDRLGDGGASEVLKAWDTKRGCYVALKVFRDDFTGDSDGLCQFQREMKAVTRLSHPNIIETYDAAQIGTTYYFAMEYVQGTDLQKVVQLSGALSIGEASDYIRQVATGLQHAHQKGLVHRDIKPANLFLVHPPGHDAPRPGVSWRRPGNPEIKIIDWGLARFQDEDDARTAEAEEGMLIGTADYIAPEQASDPGLVDIRADIYSLGCTFYYLLTGQPPFGGTSALQKIMKHQTEEPAAIRDQRPDVPQELSNIIHKMMMKQPEDRYQIPLAVIMPLRKFCNTHESYNGLSLRPGSGSHRRLEPSASGTFSVSSRGQA